MKREEFFHKLLNQAIAEAQISVLREVESTLNDKAQMIENLMYSEESFSIYRMTFGQKYEDMRDARRILSKKEELYWRISGLINKKIQELRK